MAEELSNNKVVLRNGTVLIDLTGDTITEEKILAGYTAHDKSGAPITGKCTFDSDTSGDTATADDILKGKSVTRNGRTIEGNIPINEAVSGKISDLETPYIVPYGHHDGSGKVEIDPVEKEKIKPENIRQGVSVLGVEGSMTGSEAVKAQIKTVAPSFEEQTVLPEGDYTHLSQVTVQAISVTYADNSAGGKTVTIG